MAVKALTELEIKKVASRFHVGFLAALTVNKPPLICYLIDTTLLSGSQKDII